LGPPTLAITSIEAVGITSTSVPGEARLVVDRRLIPGEDHAAASAEITAVLKGVTGLTCVAKNGALPAEQVVDDPLVVSANEALGADAEAIQGFRATCDQYVFAAVGSSVIVLGPGDLQVNRAHGPDETMLIADLVQASEVYERLVRGYLGASDTNGGG
jgi:acetylornithine deacetylase/succinyl-diaminopimelate desuccinylase-like protein